MARHKWDYITDTCINCKVLRRTKQLYRKGQLVKAGKLTEYFVNGEWVTEIPDCISKYNKSLP